LLWLLVILGGEIGSEGRVEVWELASREGGSARVDESETLLAAMGGSTSVGKPGAPIVSPLEWAIVAFNQYIARQSVLQSNPQ